jgi:hypothetical protein
VFFRFLRQPTSPSAPRLVACGRAARGEVLLSESLFPRISQVPIGPVKGDHGVGEMV